MIEPNTPAGPPADPSFPLDPIARTIAASQMPMVVSRATGDLPIVYVNAAFERLTGYAADEVLGRNCRFLQGPDTAPADVAQVRALIAGGEGGSVDILNYRKDGRSFWSALYISRVVDARGENPYFFGAQLDVSDRKHAEAELRRVSSDLEAAIAERTRELGDTLSQKTALLHEVDHRVKNNLQLVASLMMLQIRRTPDPAAKAALKSTLERVAAVSTVHRRLFQSVDVERFDLGDFLRDMVEERLGASTEDGVLDLPHYAISLPNAQAAPLALVVNELVSFVLAGGRTRAGLKLKVEHRSGRLQIAVEALAHPAEVDVFGREITELLARQLHGAAEFEERDGVRRAYLSYELDKSS